MGQDKGLMPLLGQPLIARVIAQVSGLADEVFVTTNHPEGYRTLGVPLYLDVLPDRGALGGLCTALSAARHPLVAVVACDMPFANATILAAARDRLLESGADVAIPKTETGYEPFHAISKAIHAWHDDIQDDQVGRSLASDSQPVFSIFSDGDLEVVAAQAALDRAGDQFVVFNHQEISRFHTLDILTGQIRLETSPSER